MAAFWLNCNECAVQYIIKTNLNTLTMFSLLDRKKSIYSGPTTKIGPFMRVGIINRHIGYLDCASSMHSTE